MSRQSDNDDFASILARGGCLPPMNAPKRQESVKNGNNCSHKPARKKQADRFPEFNLFVDSHLANMKQSDAVVWMIVWRHVDHRTGTATLTHSRIGQAAGLKRRAIINVMQRLTDAGYIEVIRKGGADRSPSVYRPTLPQLTGAPPCTPTGAP